MSKTIPALDDALISWIETQPVFFVATAPDGPGGHVNVSPKGHGTFRVLDPLRVAYLDLTGSGAETIAHLRQNRRITVMFPGFAGPPRTVRMHGRGTVHDRNSDGYRSHQHRFEDMPAVAHSSRSRSNGCRRHVDTPCHFLTSKKSAPR